MNIFSEGREIINVFQNKIAKLASHIVADLNKEEKLNILSMLTKLHEYHKPYFDKMQKEDIIRKLDLE